MKVNIILSSNPLPQAQFKYCMNCRAKLFMVNRGLLAIWMGEGYPPKEIPKNMGWLEFKCRSCEYMYNFYFQ